MIEFFQGVEGGDHFLAGGEVGLRHFLADLGGEGVVGIEVHGVLWRESNLITGLAEGGFRRCFTQRHKDTKEKKPNQTEWFRRSRKQGRPTNVTTGAARTAPKKNYSEPSGWF